jgi:hypothetical protein
MKLHSVSIDVTKIRKERIYVGKKGKYLNLTVAVYDEKDKYDNNVAVWEEQTKEEREAKEERNFLGNGKTVFTDQKSEQSGGNLPEDDGNDLPW